MYYKKDLYSLLGVSSFINHDDLKLDFETKLNELEDQKNNEVKKWNETMRKAYNLLLKDQKNKSLTNMDHQFINNLTWNNSISNLYSLLIVNEELSLKENYLEKQKIIKKEIIKKYNDYQSELTDAYTILKDPLKRELYDAQYHDILKNRVNKNIGMALKNICPILEKIHPKKEIITKLDNTLDMFISYLDLVDSRSVFIVPDNFLSNYNPTYNEDIMKLLDIISQNLIDLFYYEISHNKNVGDSLNNITLLKNKNIKPYLKQGQEIKLSNEHNKTIEKAFDIVKSYLDIISHLMKNDYYKNNYIFEEINRIFKIAIPKLPLFDMVGDNYIEGLMYDKSKFYDNNQFANMRIKKALIDIQDTLHEVFLNLLNEGIDVHVITKIMSDKNDKIFDPYMIVADYMTLKK